MTLSITRRQYLRTTILGAAGSAVAGCTSSSEGGKNGDATPVSGSWPMFQYNSSRTGHNPDAAAPQDGVEERWTVGVDGNQVSSPVIADNAVYISSDAGILYSFNAATGEKNWEYTPSHELNRGIPATDGESVYLSTEETVISLQSSDGEINWETDIHRPHTPAIVDGAVHVGSARLNAEDGATEWSTDDGPPRGMQAVKEGSVFFAGLKSIQAAGEGNEWSFPSRSDDINQIQPQRVVAGGAHVYFGASTGTVESKIFAVDSVVGTEQWSYRFADHRGDSTGGICVDESRLCYLEEPSIVVILDRSQGGVIAQTRLDDSVDTFFLSDPTVASETVFVNTTNGVYALDMEGNQRWHYGKVSSGRVAPAVIDGHVFVDGGGGELVALRER